MISEDDIKNADYLNIPEIIIEILNKLKSDRSEEEKNLLVRWQKAANINAANGIKSATERLKRDL